MARHIAFLAALTSAVALSPYPHSSIDLQPYFDNQAASPDGTADFNGKGACFDSQFLPPGPFRHDGITYDLPAEWGSGLDNVISNSQVIALPETAFTQEIHFIYSADAGNGTHEFVANFLLTFADNSTQTVQLYARNWWRWPILNIGVIQSPYHFEANGAQKNWNSSHIYQWSSSVLSEQPLKSITLPTLNTSKRVHLFAIAISPSIVPTSGSQETPLSIRRARFTSRWETVNRERAQVVEVTVANMLPAYTLSSAASSSKRELHVEITGANIKTLSRGVIYRLVPGDQVTVDVLVSGVQNGDVASVVIKGANGNVIGESRGWPIVPLVEKWTSDVQSLSAHETPGWWNRAKFGIFIHWGIYSVPAWAPPTNYAESYDWFLHTDTGPDNPTWAHHMATYGPDVLYDDFISNFTVSKFNASEWIDLFDQAGAKYFVLVTKHHDGYSLFDTGNSTHRSSVYLEPKRDLVAELLETSKREKPGMHRGTYYSLPNGSHSPDYAQYGFGAWPGGLAQNAANTSVLDPYTGRLNISDYINDIQLPHMLDLAIKYETEIMWCDIGGPNRTLEFAAQFYNNAMANNRQVTINNRCGAVPDFDTPEYATFGAIQTRKWESSEGMDPHSYGLNAATNASQYKNATVIVQTLVDIVSKNGNYLLDIGPTAEGEIIAPMVTGLLGAGEWLKYAGDCVYDTRFWFPGSQDQGTSNKPARFTTTPKTFCIMSFTAPTNGHVVINQRVPIIDGDEILLLTPSNAQISLPWTVEDASGSLDIDVSGADLAEIEHVWAFQVVYQSI
ncbi:glycoside hydrolase family 29 protein [Hymenopellis radicata]|nr:glycoside hydrolase family 29 protein [Hymenopellis radicata]